MSDDWQRELKCALRDLGLAARKADYSLPEAADIMRHIHECEEGLQGLVKGKSFVETSKDDNVRRLNTARSEWYVELGRVIYESEKRGELPDSLRPLAESVTRLEVKRHLAGPPSLASGGGIGAPVMRLGSEPRLRMWFNLAFAAAALAAVAVTAWILYGHAPSEPAPGTPPPSPDSAVSTTHQPSGPPEQPVPLPEPPPVPPAEPPSAYRLPEAVVLAEPPQGTWGDDVGEFPARALTAAANDPASAFLELDSALHLGAGTMTPEQKTWLEEQMAALRPAACAMLQSDFDTAVASGDVHTAVVVMAVAARFDGFTLNGMARLAAVRQALFDAAPSVYRVWQLADVRAQRIEEGRYAEYGGAYTLTPNAGFELVRVTANVINVASDGERPYCLWALSEAQRALARAVQPQQDGSVPARLLARNYAFILADDGNLYECSFIPQDSPLRGSPQQPGSVKGPAGTPGIDCPPIPVPKGGTITFDGIFGVPQGATSLRLWISGAVPAPVDSARSRVNGLVGSSVP